LTRRDVFVTATRGTALARQLSSLLREVTSSPAATRYLPVVEGIPNAPSGKTSPLAAIQQARTCFRSSRSIGPSIPMLILCAESSHPSTIAFVLTTDPERTSASANNTVAESWVPSGDRRW
jgi:hypothetical protein